VNKVKSLI